MFIEYDLKNENEFEEQTADQVETGQHTKAWKNSTYHFA